MAGQHCDRLAHGLPIQHHLQRNANLNAPNNTQTPDLIGTLHYTNAGRSSLHQYLSPSGFQEVPAAITSGTYRFGTLGLETARGPQFANVDLGLFRRFPIHDQIQMQFRGEALNLLNHANFGNPSSSFSNSSTATSFGVISSVNSGTHLIAERYFRLGLKITF